MIIAGKLFLFAASFCLLGSNIQAQNSGREYTGNLERTYLTPQKILWQSEDAEISNIERLLTKGKHQASTVNSDLCLLKNADGQASLLLDFGKEIHGGLEIVTGMWPGNKPINVSVRFGESVSEAMAFISEYWGAMLDLGATSFGEDFNMDWAKNAGRIDELQKADKVDIHKAYGDYCYKGLRHSFCHGWASGPTAWLSQYVLGVEVLEPGCKKVKK
jgi:hypothetical protein